MLTWLWISSFLVLLGAAFNAEIEKLQALSASMPEVPGETAHIDDRNDDLMGTKESA
jgi:uncharacterized BrkB/YihY/UPF0761 family membrane protein